MHPSKATLNFRGSEYARGWRKKWRVIASAYGVGLNGSSGEMPAKGHVTTLRTVLPPAPEVVMPASASRRSAGRMSAGSMKCAWKFCLVVMWPKPRE